MGWDEVEIIAPVGTQFGIVSDGGRKLVVTVKPVGTEGWPHGIQPTSGRNEIAEGCTRYVVTDDSIASMFNLNPLADFNLKPFSPLE